MIASGTGFWFASRTVPEIVILLLLFCPEETEKDKSTIKTREYILIPDLMFFPIPGGLPLSFRTVFQSDAYDSV